MTRRQEGERRWLRGWLLPVLMMIVAGVGACDASRGNSQAGEAAPKQVSENADGLSASRLRSGTIAYELRLKVPDHCHFSDPPHEHERKPAVGDFPPRIILSVTITREPGICAQSIKTIMITGTVYDVPQGLVELVVDVVNSRNGNVTRYLTKIGES